MVGVIASLVLASPGLAQGAPRLGIEVTSAPELTAEQQKLACDFAESWAAVMSKAGAKPEEVEKARDELVEPLQRLAAAVSPHFRHVYAGCLAPSMQRVIGGENLHAAVNAVIVVSQLGQDKAINVLLPLADMRNEQRWQVRLQAAFGCKTLLGSRLLEFRKIKDAASRLRDAAAIEEHPLILGRQLSAIDAADHSGLQAAERPQVREILVDALCATVDRIEKLPNNPHVSPLLEPITRAAHTLRIKYTSSALQPDERRRIAPKLAPRLGAILAIVGKKWDACRQDPQFARACTVIVANSESFLQILAAEVASSGQMPQSRLKDAWAGGNRDQYAADLDRWQATLSNPPFAK